jgi:hypothetical protein
MTDCRQRRAGKGGNAEIHPDELMMSWIYDEKFLTGMRFLFETWPVTVREDDNLEQPAQEQEEWCTMTINFKFHRCLKNSVTTFQATVRQPDTTNLINGSTRPPIETPSSKTRSSELALSEIQITNPKESS